MQIKFLVSFLLVSFLTFSQSKDATSIIQQAIDKILQNNPEVVLESFQYKKYTKGLMQKRALENNALITSPNNYLFEKLSLHQFEQKNKHLETVLASNLPGFKEPIYPIFVKSFHSTSVYEKEYELFNNRFHGPLSENALKHYAFKLKETVSSGSGKNPYHIITFSPNNSSAAAQLQGELHIDMKTFAVQNATIQHTKNLEASILHEFIYYEKENIWFPSKTTAEVQLLNKLESVTLLGGFIPPGKMRFDADENSTTSFTLTSVNHEIKLNDIDPIDKEHLSIEALEEENKIRTSEVWNGYRDSSLTTDEIVIETNADIVVRANKLEKRIGRVADFGKGYYRIGFFDVDLKVLFKYNVWEGIRLGVGGLTNERLSDRFRVGGYIVRVLDQGIFNYQLTSNYLIFPETKTYLGATYTKDIQEMGENPFLNSQRTYNLFEPRLVNITQFYRHRTIQTNLTHQINPRFNTEIQVSKSDVEQIIPYTYINNGNALTDYSVVQAKAGILWAPFGQFVETPSGISEYNVGYPRVSAQVTQSFEGFLDGDFNFTKFDLRIDHQVKHINRSFTEVVFEGNVGFGEIPLTHAYHAYPNSPNKETIVSRFSVAGNRSFETMYFGEFFSDKLASVQIKHQLKPLVLSAKIKPEFVLITRHAIGDFSNMENHPEFTFNTLEKGYSESGFEINKIFWGFGLSFAYRYGAYHLPAFEDNVAFKFTFKLEI